MKKILLVLVFCAIFLTSCMAAQFANPVSAGTVVSASQIATSFNEPDLTVITTQTNVFMVKGLHSVVLGAAVVEYDWSYGADSGKCIRVGDGDCWRIWQ